MSARNCNVDLPWCFDKWTMAYSKNANSNNKDFLA